MLNDYVGLSSHRGGEGKILNMPEVDVNHSDRRSCSLHQIVEDDWKQERSEWGGGHDWNRGEEAQLT